METVQLLRIRMVALSNEGRILCSKAQSPHHWFPLDVVAGLEEMVTLRASGTEEGMVEGRITQVMVRGTGETRR